MRFPWLKPVLDAPGPFLSVYLDTTRTDPASAADLASRWAGLRRGLAGSSPGGSPGGTTPPDALLDGIEESVLEPSGIGGAHGRAIITTAGSTAAGSDPRAHIDRVIPVPPSEDSATWGDRPVLLPLLRVAARAVRLLVVEVDRAGADFSLRAPDDPRPAGSADALGGDATVDGGHDVLHKPSGPTGWKKHRFEARVEDSWERNASTVAGHLDRLVREYRPELVVVTGDVRAVALLRGAVSHETARLAVEVPGGVRGNGTDPREARAFHAQLAAAVEDFARRRRDAVAARFHEESGRAGHAVSTPAEVAGALRRGQVDEVVVVDGSEPADVEELIRLAIATDAGVTLLHPEPDGRPGPDGGSGVGVSRVPGGVGALLRWKDPVTPGGRLPSMSGDLAREAPAASP